MESDALIWSGPDGAYVTEATLTLNNRREVEQVIGIMSRFIEEFNGVLPDEIELATAIIEGLLPNYGEHS